MATIARRKNAILGTVTGLILQVFNLLVPFFIRSIFIRYIGAEYAGLNSLFTSVLQVLNLAELGVGSALVFSMYKPIVDDDQVKLCALMKLYRTYYRVIGLIVLIVGLAITPALPYLISGSIPSDLNLYVLYYLNLAATVASYWLFSYKNSILSAYQRTDIVNVVTFCVNVVKYVLQIISILIWRNYYLYLIINLAFQLILNCVTAIVVQIMFPNLHPNGDISKDERKIINGKVRDLFTAKLGGVIVNSADSIVISSFLGLTPLAIYNNYYYILSAVNALIAVFYNAIRAGIANELLVDGEQKKLKDFYTLTFIIFLLISICTPCFLNLYQPFMTLWVGEDLLLEQSSVYWFAIYFVVYQIPLLWATYKDAAGVWRQDRFRPLIGAFVNLISNIILVNFIGINGILISTIISYVFVSIPWLLINLKKYVINYSLKKYFLDILLYLAAIGLFSVISVIICNLIPATGIVQIVVNFLVSILCGGLGFVACFFWTKEFKNMFAIAKSILRSRR